MIASQSGWSHSTPLKIRFTIPTPFRETAGRWAFRDRPARSHPYEMEFEILEGPQSDVKIHFQEGKTSFSFYYITENILKVTSAAMKFRVMEFYIHFYIRKSGIKIFPMVTV